MYYQCQCSVPFLSWLYFSCFSDVFLGCLHLFVYSFKCVIQVHHVASIHLRGRRAWETWNIGFCSTLRVIKCLYPIKCSCKGWIPCLLSSGHLGAIVCIYVATPSARSSSWNMSHPAEKLLNWNTKYMIYGTNQLWLKKYQVNFMDNLNDTLQSALSWFSSKKLCWWLFVTQKPQKTEGHLKHDFTIHHLPHLWLRRNFFENIGNIFLHYLVALSSCNTRFREEKWELSQLKYSGEMQLLQKHFDMEKYICGCWLSKQEIHRIQENIPIINADLRCTISENFQSYNIY